VPDVRAKGYTGRELRYALLRVHYRVPLNFTWEGMEEARQSLARIDEWLARLRECSASVSLAKGIGRQAGSLPYTFEEALDDDLNISAALGFLFESIRETNRALDRNELNAASASAWLKWWERINTVLDVEERKPVAAVVTGGRLEMKGTLGIVHIRGGPLPAEIANLLEERAQARLAKNFQKSDELRNELSARGWEVRDIKDGQQITRRASG
jgi:cysteinyl-tRNA synthetase